MILNKYMYIYIYIRSCPNQGAAGDSAEDFYGEKNRDEKNRTSPCAMIASISRQLRGELREMTNFWVVFNGILWWFNGIFYGILWWFNGI